MLPSLILRAILALRAQFGRKIHRRRQKHPELCLSVETNRLGGDDAGEQPNFRRGRMETGENSAGPLSASFFLRDRDGRGFISRWTSATSIEIVDFFLYGSIVSVFRPAAILCHFI